ncbi:MAG: chromosomal replication initiator protein DnaA [Oscillospiraceae bacterium]
MNSFDDVWLAVCEYLKTEMKINDSVFNLWFKNIIPVSFDGQTAILSVENPFKLKIIKEQYSEIILKACTAILGFEIIIEYIESETVENKDFKDDSISLKGDTENSFDTFVVGKTNNFAFATAKKVAAEPGKNYNPLLIYGKSGLGKTHLLRAIEHEIKKNNPSANIIFITSENFTNDLISHIRTSNMQDFHEKYRNADVLLVDDIQFIVGKDQTEEEFFHTFNSMHEAHKQIVLTSDNPPDEIPNLQDRIKTRFSWGLIADIKSPDFETRMAIIKNKSEAINFDIPDNVIEFIAEQVKNNVRQLEGVIKKLNALCLFSNSKPTIETAKEAIKEAINLGQPLSVTIDKIINQVGNTFGVTKENMISEKRDKSIKDARQIAMYIMREITGMSFDEIGKYFGGKKHTTVRHSYYAVIDKTKEDSSFKKIVEDVIKNVKEF